MSYNEQDNNLNSETINSFINQKIALGEVNEFDLNRISEIIGKYDNLWSSIDIYK
jgi:hypothetical protein